MKNLVLKSALYLFVNLDDRFPKDSFAASSSGPSAPKKPKSNNCKL
jgi:hypothetical protein